MCLTVTTVGARGGSHLVTRVVTVIPWSRLCVTTVRVAWVARTGWGLTLCDYIYIYLDVCGVATGSLAGCVVPTGLQALSGYPI